MIEEVRRLISLYARRGILIDTNILLLYFIGSFNLSLIPNFKRTLQFSIEDFQTLLYLLEPFDKLVTTPNILTEVSNLSGQLGEPVRTLYFQTFAKMILIVDEHYVKSTDAVSEEEFIRKGLTDIGILHLSKDRFLVLTDDFSLSQYLQKKGVDVINFNHIRPLGWT